MNSDLNSASKYLNNLLASRGLLRDGNSIPFANPGESAETATQIINLVHDLVNKRDRDAEQRESLAMTVRTLKALEEKNNTTIDRLKKNCDEMSRRYAILQAEERILSSAARTAEAKAKSLKDETARLKTMVQQVRAQCANDIRKRDVQISRMKERLQENTRGGRGSRQPVSLPCVTLSAAASASALGASRGPVSAINRQLDREDSPADSTLTNDTTAFLTSLSQSLSDENETLASMIRNTITTIKAISGMDSSSEGSDGEDDEDGEGGGGRMVVARDNSHVTLARDMDHVLYDLRELLNQPNYVPVEDLVYRDREIERLKVQVKGLHLEWRKAIELVEIVNRRSATLTAKESTVLDNVIEKGKRTVLEELHLNFEPPRCADKDSTIIQADKTVNHGATADGEELDFEAEISAHLSQINPMSPIQDKSYMEQFSPVRDTTVTKLADVSCYDSHTQTPSVLKPHPSSIKKPSSKFNSKRNRLSAAILRR